MIRKGGSVALGIFRSFFFFLTLTKTGLEEFEDSNMAELAKELCKMHKRNVDMGKTA